MSDEVDRLRTLLEVVRGYEDVLDTEMDYPDGDVEEDFNSAVDSVERQIDKLERELTAPDDQYHFESQEAYDEFILDHADEVLDDVLQEFGTDQTVGRLKDEIRDFARDKAQTLSRVKTLEAYDAIETYSHESLDVGDVSVQHDDPHDMINHWGRSMLREDIRAKAFEKLEETMGVEA